MDILGEDVKQSEQKYYPPWDSQCVVVSTNDLSPELEALRRSVFGKLEFLLDIAKCIDVDKQFEIQSLLAEIEYFLKIYLNLDDGIIYRYLLDGTDMNIEELFKLIEINSDVL